MSVAFDVVRVIAAQIAAFLAVLLFASGVHKMVNRLRTKAVIQGLLDLPPGPAAILVPLVIIAEIVAGALFWMPFYRGAGAVLAAVLWTGYLAVMARAFYQGRLDIDCGCSFGGSHRESGGLDLARSALLAFLAIGVGGVSLLGSPGRIAATQILAAFAFFAFYIALDQVMALRPLRQGDWS